MDDESVPPTFSLREDRSEEATKKLLQNLIAFLLADEAPAVPVETVIARGLADVVGGRRSLDAMALGLWYAASLRRPEYPILIGDHRARMEPRLNDADRVQAIWQIDDIVGRLLEVRDFLLNREDEPQEQMDRVALVERVGYALHGVSTRNLRSVELEEATFIVCMVLLVAELRLPSVLRSLAAEDCIDRERVDQLTPSLMGSDEECIVALIRGRWPTTAAKLQGDSDRMPSLSSVVHQARYSRRIGRTKWHGLAELLKGVGLVGDRGTPESVRVSYADSPHNLGELADHTNRGVVWEHLSDFFAVIGAGKVQADRWEATWNRVVNAEPEPEPEAKVAAPRRHPRLVKR